MLACVTESEPCLLVVEYCSEGDLLEFLRKRWTISNCQPAKRDYEFCQGIFRPNELRPNKKEVDFLLWFDRNFCLLGYQNYWNFRCKYMMKLDEQGVNYTAPVEEVSELIFDLWSLIVDLLFRTTSTSRWSWRWSSCTCSPSRSVTDWSVDVWSMKFGIIDNREK